VLYKEVLGHNKIKDILTRARNEARVGHAYVFEGPSGVGKLNMAKAFANHILCESPNPEDSCGMCKACSSCSSHNHPDVVIVTNEHYGIAKKTKNLSVETIREMKNDIYIRPYLSDHKIYIVPDAETMNNYAQNSLLKVLEEPPIYCTIILLVENSNKLLDTVLSRSQVLRFYPLEANEICNYLIQNNSDADRSRIELASYMCGGSLGRAEEILENDELFELRNETLDCLFSLNNEKRKCISDFAVFLKENKDEFDFILNIIQGVFRDLLYIKKTENLDEVLNKDRMKNIEKLSDAISEKTPLVLMESLLKHKGYQQMSMSFGLIAQNFSLEVWEAINDRGYRS